MISSQHTSAKQFQVRVLRQDGPGQENRWEVYKIDHEPDMNVISVLQRVAAKGQTIDGRASSCSMGLQLPRRSLWLLHHGDQWSCPSGVFRSGRPPP